MKTLITCLLVLASQFAQAQVGQSLMSVVTIAKKPATNRYVFAICQGAQCERIGRESGYTADQLDAFNGGLQQVGAVAMGMGEGAVIAYATGSAIAIGVGYESMVLVIGGAGSTTIIPSVAIHYVKSINPFEKFYNGEMKSELEYSVDQMVVSGKASIVIFQSADFAETLAFARRAHSVLTQIR